METFHHFVCGLAPFAKSRRRHSSNEAITIAGGQDETAAAGKRAPPDDLEATAAAAVAEKRLPARRGRRARDKNESQIHTKSFTGKRLLDFLVRCHRVSRCFDGGRCARRTITLDADTTGSTDEYTTRYDYERAAMLSALLLLLLLWSLQRFRDDNVTPPLKRRRTRAEKRKREKEREIVAGEKTYNNNKMIRVRVVWLLSLEIHGEKNAIGVCARAHCTTRASRSAVVSTVDDFGTNARGVRVVLVLSPRRRWVGAGGHDRHG